LPFLERMSQEDVIRLREGYAAFNRGDLNAILETLDPEVVFIQAEELPGAEIYRGHEGVRKWLADLTAAFDDLRAEPEELLDAGDRLVALLRLRGRGRGSGAPFEAHVAHVFEVRAGKIVRWKAYMDRATALRAAGLPATG
jgi:uncharacterized protein